LGLDKTDFSEYPETYKDNDNKEKLILAYAENFRRQYIHLFRDRKPLFLNPLNECGVEVGFFHDFSNYCTNIFE